MTVEDIEAGRAPRPRVLDPFAGGGAIPLEALRLGCEAYALDLNPVTHIIELCTLVYPQKYGRPDPTARGMTGPPGPEGNPTWGGLADEVRYWGNWVLEKVKTEIGDLYPPIPDPDDPPEKLAPEPQLHMTGDGFDPAAFSKGGNATCPFCGTVADSTYVKAEGCAKRMGQRMMVIVCTRPGRQGKVYLSADDYPEFVPDDVATQWRIEELCGRTGLTVPEEPLPPRGTLGFRVQPYGFRNWGQLFSPRQALALATFVAALRRASDETQRTRLPVGPGDAVVSHLGLYLDRGTDHWSSFCAWNPSGEKLQHTYGRQALPMVWDFAEANPFGSSVGDWAEIVANAEPGIWAGTSSGTTAADVKRGSATSLPWQGEFADAVVTDPPYYDNVPYADLSDFFYVWLKRSIGHLCPEHFATELTPKKGETIAEPVRHGGDMSRARTAYETMMGQAFAEAGRVLKPSGHMTVVYAHKTTLGWATLVDALRGTGFTVTEAWPVETEMRTRLRGMDSAALASSIFLVARKREADVGVGNYEDDVQPELTRIVRERVDTLWKLGIPVSDKEQVIGAEGADLVIAAVGAGLRAFTRFERVEYANGEEVPAEKFLTEVEGVVLDTMLGKLFGLTGGNVSAVDAPSRFYVLWRFVYKAAEIDAGEAIVFSYGQPVELDGPHGLSSGPRAVLQKKKGKYRLRDFTEHGADDKLGRAGEEPAPLIDTLHRLLWLLENQPRRLGKFLEEGQPDRERLRLVAQALGGPGLSGGAETQGLLATTSDEQSALQKLLANWRAVMGEGGLFAAPRGAGR